MGTANRTSLSQTRGSILFRFSGTQAFQVPLLQVPLPQKLTSQQDRILNGVAIGDIDGDGKPDIVVINSNSNTVSVFRNTSTSGSITASSFAPKVDFTTGYIATSVLQSGDVDGDGKPDLVVIKHSSNTISVLKNTSLPVLLLQAPLLPRLISQRDHIPCMLLLVMWTETANQTSLLQTMAAILFRSSGTQALPVLLLQAHLHPRLTSQQERIPIGVAIGDVRRRRQTGHRCYKFEQQHYFGIQEHKLFWFYYYKLICFEG